MPLRSRRRTEKCDGRVGAWAVAPQSCARHERKKILVVEPQIDKERQVRDDESRADGRTQSDDDR